ncbi:MAG: SCO family protein [Propionibacteriaceae bacterium]
MSSSRTAAVSARVLVLALLFVWAAGCTAPSQAPVVRVDADPSGFLGGTSLPNPYVMPDQTLTDTSGHDYNLRTSPSKPVTLMFFGYTHCPDVCIGVLSEVATALSRMPVESRDRVQMIFVTTDPARDTPRVVKTYLDRFDPTFLGLTGDLSTIKAVAERVGVDIEGMKKLPGGGYEVGHSAQLIGFDKQHRGVVIWTPSTPIGDLTKDFQHLVAQQQ